MKEFFNLQLVESAQHEFAKLGSELQRKVINDIEYLTINPYPDRSRRIGETTLYRLRVEDWRVIYSVNDNERVIKVYAIRKKRDMRFERA
jgi:mRNA interferase RelE/StbE